MDLLRVGRAGSVGALEDLRSEERLRSAMLGDEDVEDPHRSFDCRRCPKASSDTLQSNSLWNIPSSFSSSSSSCAEKKLSDEEDLRKTLLLWRGLLAIIRALSQIT